MRASPMTIRPAKLFDAAEIHALMQPYVTQGVLLPRPLRYLCENIRDFMVVEQGGRIVASGALHFLDEDVAEIQSLAVAPARRGGGLGAQLVAALLEQARVHQVWKVIALTHVPEFFHRLGFATTEIGALPQKFSRDCAACPKRPTCHQVAVIRDVFSGAPLTAASSAAEMAISH